MTNTPVTSKGMLHVATLLAKKNGITISQGYATIAGMAALAAFENDDFISSAAEFYALAMFIMQMASGHLTPDERARIKLAAQTDGLRGTGHAG